MLRRDRGFVFGTLAPAVIVLVLIFLYPLGRSISYSFTNYNLIDQTDDFVGFANYRQLFADPTFYTALINTLALGICPVIGGFLIGFAQALALNEIKIGRGFLRGLALLPWVVPQVVVAFLFLFMYNPSVGVFNVMLHDVGLIGAYQPWLAHPATAPTAVVLAYIWNETPFFMLMLLAGLSAIPQELIEASSRRWRRLVAATALYHHPQPTPHHRHQYHPDGDLEFQQFQHHLAVDRRRAGELDANLLGLGVPPGVSEFRSRLCRHHRGTMAAAADGGDRNLYPRARRQRRGGMRPGSSPGPRSALQRKPARRGGTGSRHRRLVKPIGLAAIVTVLLAFSLLPIVWMAFTSFKSRSQVFGTPGALLPSPWTLSAYRAVLESDYFLIYFKNSLIVNIAASLITVVLATLAGYSFSRFRIPGKSALMLFILAMQMFPSTVLLIALYVVFRHVHLLNTYTALILSFVTHGLPFSIWMMRGFVDAVPADVEEAAMIDGANRLQVLIYVVVPMISPGMIAVGLFGFLAGWNDLVWALTLTTTPSMRLIPPGFVATWVGQFETYWNQLMAASMMVSLPTMLVFAYLQRYLVQGLTAGAVKG